MNFLRIDMLFCIWLVPVLALVYYYGWRKRRRILGTFARTRMQALIAPQGLESRRRWRALLVLLAVLFTAAALAGPQYGFQWQTVEQRGIDMIIALDCSRSMLANDIQPTRLDRAKRKIYDLLGMLQGDRIGLAAFSGTAFMQCPLTLDYQAFNLFLEVLGPDYLPVGGTDLAAAVRVAADGFGPQSAAQKAIILITDGEHTGDEDPMQAAQAAKEAGITLFCIGVGSDQAVPIPSAQGGFTKDRGDQIILSRLDEALLTRMATATGGTYVRSVAGDLDLEAVYRDHIRSAMEQTMVEGGRKQVWADRYQWPLGLAVALLLAALWIPGGRGTRLTAVALLIITASSWPVQPASAADGYQAYKKGQYDQALKQFIDRQLEDPDNPELLYNIGNAYYKTGDYQAAEGHYRQSLQAAEPPLKSGLYYNLGNTAYRQGKLQEAIENYQKAIELAPDDAQARENLAFVKRQLQQQQQSQPNQDGQSSGETGKEPQNSGSQDPENQDGQTPGQAQSQGEQQPGQQQNAPQSGAPGAQQDQKQAPDIPQAQQNTTEGQPEQQAGQRQSPSAADQALRRLKDEPGRALMPNYQKRRVEKDW